MKVKLSDYYKVLQFVREHWPAIREAAQEAEAFKGAKTGPEKKAAVMAFAETIYRTIDEDSTTVTPAMVEVALAITDKLVDALVAFYNKLGKFQK